MAGNSLKPQSERSPGRPRSAQVHEAILHSTIQLLAEAGYERISIEAVAAHAGVGKTAIYRRWSSKEELVVDALASVKTYPDVPESGSVRQDIILWVGAFMQNLENPIERHGIALLIGTLFNHPQLAERYWMKYALPITRTLAEVLQRGQERGEIQPNIDPAAVIDILSGTVFYQIFMKPPSERTFDNFKQAVDMLLLGIAGPQFRA